MKSILVFCGSNPGRNERFAEHAHALGRLFAIRGIRLIYGGSKVGLMGIIADSVLRHGGKATGIIPDFLCKKEVAHRELTELIIVKTLQERKQAMASLCDGILTLPGGFGTLDELFEILTWTQLGKINHPIGLLNWEGYFDHLILQLQHMTDEQFLKPENHALLLSDSDAEALLQKMDHNAGSRPQKWIHQDHA